MNVPPNNPPYPTPQPVKPPIRGDIRIETTPIHTGDRLVKTPPTVKSSQTKTTQKEETLAKWEKILSIGTSLTTILTFLEKRIIEMIQWLKRGGQPKK
jgi:hypothetical protein